MSSKLVKKLLQQTAVPLTNNEYDDGVGQNKARKRYTKPSTKRSSSQVISKEEMVQEHVQSLLRLDNLAQRYTTSKAQKSFDRHSSNIKQEQKEKQNTKRKAVAGISNSRGSSSSFAQKPHEKRFDKVKDKRSREEGYFEDLARALKKAKKGGKKSQKKSS